MLGYGRRVDESRGFGRPLAAADLFSEETFGTRLSRRAGVLWLAMGGELDVFSAPELRAALREAKLGPAETLVLDMRGLGFIDSSGLAVILGAHERANREQANPVQIVIKDSAAVESLFELIGARDYLEVIEGVDDLDRSESRRPCDSDQAPAAQGQATGPIRWASGRSADRDAPR